MFFLYIIPIAWIIHIIRKNVKTGIKYLVMCIVGYFLFIQIPIHSADGANHLDYYILLLNSFAALNLILQKLDG